MPDPSYRVSTRSHPSRGWAGAENEGWQAVVAVSAVRGHGWISFFLSPITSCTDGFGEFRDFTIVNVRNREPVTRAFSDLQLLYFYLFIYYLFHSKKIHEHYDKIEYILLKIKLYFDKKKTDSKLELNVL